MGMPVADYLLQTCIGILATTSLRSWATYTTATELYGVFTFIHKSSSLCILFWRAKSRVISRTWSYGFFTCTKWIGASYVIDAEAKISAVKKTKHLLML